MPRSVLIIAFVLNLLSFLLSTWKGRRGPRYGRMTRFMGFIFLESILVISCFRLVSVSPGQLSLCFLTAVLVLLLLPVPPGKRLRLTGLSLGCVAAIPVPVFLPVLGYVLIPAFILLSRIILARRRTASLDALARVVSLRKAMEQDDGANWTIVLLVLLLFCRLATGSPVAEAICCSASFFLYIWLDFRWSAASCFFAVPRLDDAVARAQAGRSRINPLDSFTPDHDLYERCCRYMAERRPFLVESFSLTDLCNAMFSNKVYLSRTINECSGKNFRQWVNNYRVHYSMDLFHRNMSLKVIDLATLSGFHSCTTFNMAFKSVMDESPSTWCKRVRYRSVKI